MSEAEDYLRQLAPYLAAQLPLSEELAAEFPTSWHWAVARYGSIAPQMVANEWLEARRRGDAQVVHPPARGACQVTLVHHLVDTPPARAAAIRVGYDIDGHPPDCPAHRPETRTEAVTEVLDDEGWQQSVDWHAGYEAGKRAAAESREPAAPVQETPAGPPACTCDARPGQGHLLRCAVWA